jgi:hypothetical protein
MNILSEGKPQSIKLADGKEYILPALDLTTLANIEQTMGFSLGKIKEKITEQAAGTLRQIVFALLKENYPDVTIEDAGKLVTFNEMRELATVFSAIIAISG